ncbi:hypothetical protein OESDEN_15130 [Oesophagostomum dentatum]|uniref:ShKT domain-containing protein n=1 Tax=Oesophagostomum dentatum TaxID=61180 RepID=A0A0B1SIL5_OESDE|nr:hypothetical protein OESDEN_15130 [Oesophagostomum dentatum]
MSILLTTMISHSQKLVFTLLLFLLTTCEAQPKACDAGKVFECARSCYPSCTETTGCPEVSRSLGFIDFARNRLMLGLPPE